MPQISKPKTLLTSLFFRCNGDQVIHTISNALKSQLVSVTHCQPRATGKVGPAILFHILSLVEWSSSAPNAAVSLSYVRVSPSTNVSVRELRVQLYRHNRALHQTLTGLGSSSPLGQWKWTSTERGRSWISFWSKNSEVLLAG